MILESAQLLCTQVRVLGGTATIVTAPDGKKKEVYLLPDETYWFTPRTVIMDEIAVIVYDLHLSTGLYIQTHINHPCSVWVRSSIANWNYVFQLMLRLECEWNLRYEHTKDHPAITSLCKADIFVLTRKYFPAILQAEPFTPPALAMPEQYRTNNPVESYRAYYNNDKRHLHKWTNREIPFWITLENINEQR
jgi:hypothetical protein